MYHVIEVTGMVVFNLLIIGACLSAILTLLGDDDHNKYA